MVNAMVKRILILIVVAIVAATPEVQAQSTLGSLYEKAKKVLKSDNKEQAWEDATPFLDNYRYVVPVTGRKFINVVPDDLLLSMSERQYKSRLNSSNLSNSRAQKAQLTRVANNLIAAVNKYYRSQGKSSEAAQYKWEVNLVKDDDMNAFCMPGGKIVVYDGILKAANDDAALAIVLSHEIAHAMAKHSAEQLSKSVMTTAGVATIVAILNNSDMSETKRKISKLITAAGATLVNLKFSRKNETEADRIGLILAAMAGYNPERAVSFWQAMEKENGRTLRDWYSTHPSSTNRIANIRSFLPEAKRYYKNNVQ